jgi:hypothetical protein
VIFFAGPGREPAALSAGIWAACDHRLDRRHPSSRPAEGGKIMGALYRGLIVAGVLV